MYEERGEFALHTYIRNILFQKKQHGKIRTKHRYTKENIVYG